VVNALPIGLLVIKEVVWKISRHSYRTNDDRFKNRGKQGFNLPDFELHCLKKAFVLLYSGLILVRSRALACIQAPVLASHDQD